MKLSILNKFTTFFLIASFFVFISCKTEETKISDLIEKEKLKSHVDYLSSKELKGRLSASDEYYIASEYVKSEFQKYGLKAFEETNYFQPFFIEYNQIERANFIVLDSNARNSYKLGYDYVCRGFSGSGKVNAEVVFCGYGLDEEDLNYSDYAGIDIKEKIAMVFKFNPSWKISDKHWTQASIRDKVHNAVKHGAKGIVFVSKPNDRSPQPVIGSVYAGEGIHYENVPQMHISIELANEILAKSNRTLSSLQSEIDATKQSISYNTATKVQMFVDARYQKEKESRNVMAFIEGKDPRLKDEFILLTAHLDHVGNQGNELYYPGANDNASGVAAILEIARVIKENRLRPKKSIAFIVFDGEEQGLKGSKHFVEHPPIELKKINAVFNFDCVGFGDSIMVGGGKSVPGVWNLIKQMDADNDNLMAQNTWYGGGADAEPFFQKGIPTLYFVTTNSYKNLHLPGDNAETLNYELAEALVKLGSKISWQMANVKSKPAIVPLRN